MKLFEPIFYSLFIYVVKSSTIQSQNNPQGNENKSAVRGDTRNLGSVSGKFTKRNGIREEKGEVPEKFRRDSDSNIYLAAMVIQYRRGFDSFSWLFVDRNANVYCLQLRVLL